MQLQYLLAAVPFVSGLIAQVEAESLARYGILGCVLAWFMFRADKRLGGIEHKMAGLNRTMLIEILSRPTTSEKAKQMCRDELKKVAPDLAAEFQGE